MFGQHFLFLHIYKKLDSSCLEPTKNKCNLVYGQLSLFMVDGSHETMIKWCLSKIKDAMSNDDLLYAHFAVKKLSFIEFDQPSSSPTVEIRPGEISVGGALFVLILMCYCGICACCWPYFCAAAADDDDDEESESENSEEWEEEQDSLIGDSA